MQSVEHIPIVLEDWNFKGGFNNLLDLILGFLLIMNEFYAFLLILLSEQVRSLFHESLRCLQLPF
jgi:hypothetical protein